MAVGEDVIIAASVRADVQPPAGGPFELLPPPDSYVDVLLARVPPAGNAFWAAWVGSADNDDVSNITRRSTATVIAGRTFGGVGCADAAQGCAYFIALDEDGAAPRAGNPRSAQAKARTMCPCARSA